jgi:hypothetical protein
MKFYSNPPKFPPMRTLISSGSFRTFCSESKTEKTFKETQLQSSTALGKFKLRIKEANERFKKRRAEYVVQYGSSFIIVHEVLGISSYLITFGLLYSGIIPLTSIVEFLGWTEADLAKYGIDIHGKLITFAMTVAVVKGLDVMGLVPFRWMLTFLITPRIAWLIGPYVDKLFAAIRRGGRSIKGLFIKI